MPENSIVTHFKDDASRIAEITNFIGACRTKEEVQEFADSLPPEERWMTACLTPEHYCAFFRDQDGRPKPYNGVSGSNAITISYSGTKENTRQEDADAAYEALFELISSGLKEAVNQNKRLVVFIGESHSNRGSLMLDLMAADIAKNLGITDIGVENEAHAVTFQTLDGRTVERPGLKGWGDHADALMQDGRFPENHELASPPDKRVANRAVFIPQLFDVEANHVFPTDRYTQDETKIDELLDKRDIFQAKRIVAGSEGSHVMHFGGSAHIYGLEKNLDALQKMGEAPDSYFLGIRTEQDAYLTPEFMYGADPLIIERYTAPCIRGVLVNGRIPTIEHARELARNTKISGKKLADQFFKDNPLLAPQLESMQVGGRVETSQSMQRFA